MLNLGRDPKAFRSHFSRYAASVIMTVTYDHPVQSLNDPLVKAVNERLDSFAKWIKPAASPLDSVPFLEYLPLPLNPWKREGLRLHKLELDLFLSLFLDVRRRVKSGEANECFVSKLQEKQKALGLTDEEAAYLAGSLFGAGSDTTASAISIFVMAMIRTPAVHDKAQEELDRVIGDERMPTFDDLPSLPYIRATLKETLRWRPVSSGGFSHQLTEDTEYKGYVLPKGSAVVGNHW